MDTENYNKALAQLNDAQRKAVQTTEGPVMMLAGPGTGKTQTLALRVAYILETTQMRPSNILCLTFSMAGVIAMRKRLRQIIGPDAYGVTVHTIHGFCNDIIMQYPDIFTDFKAREQISEVQQIRTVRAALQKLPTGSVLGAPSKSDSSIDRSSDILRRISDMKREGKSPEDLEALIPQYGESIKYTPTGKERNLESKVYLNDLRKVQQFEEFITIYKAYQTSLNEKHLYDYNDMILVTHKVLKEQDWILATLQERYQYLLVDEFQDLNGAQTSIINILTTYPTSDTPNVFVVGDDDQAIYKFQGANLGNMLEFKQRHKAELVTITLEKNYRSHQDILNAAELVISNNIDRLSTTSLQAAGPSKDVTPQTSSTEYGNPELLDAGIVKQLQTWIEDGVDINEIAILCRTNGDVKHLSDALQVAGIPAIVTGKRDLLRQPTALQLINLLYVLENPDQSTCYTAALRLSTLEIPPVEVGKMLVALKQHNRTQEPMSLRAFLLQQPALHPQLQAAVELIEDLHTNQHNVTLTDLIQDLMLRSGLIHNQDSAHADPNELRVVSAFYDYVKRRCYEQKTLTLRDLLSDLEIYMTEPGLNLEYSIAQTVAEGVQLTTAHSSKGLEYQAVLLYNTRYGHWGNRRGGGGLSLPDTLILGLDPNQKHEQQEDERRLFYVALTRAKQYLHCGYSATIRRNDSLQPTQPSAFVAEIGTQINEQAASNTLQPLEPFTLEIPDLSEEFKVYLKERLEQFELSVTALNAFLTDPQEFIWTHLLLQPRSKKAHLAYGTAVHSALETRSMAQKNNEEFGTDKLIDSFIDTMTRRELMTEKERDHYLHIGAIVLERYGNETSTAPLLLSTERSLKARLGDIPLTGKVDRIDLFELNGQNVRIVDYKTGTPKRTEAAIRKDENLFRQLVFYKLLADESPSFTHSATMFSLVFLGTEKQEPSTIDLSITEAEVTELKELIKKVWSKLENFDFTSIE